VLSDQIALSEKQEEAWHYLDDPNILEVFAGGGAGGGKSMLGCTRQIYRRLAYKGTRGFIGRESFTGLRDSTMNTYFGLLGAMGYRSIDHYTYNAQEHTVYWKNGNAEYPPSEQHFRHMAYMPSDPDYNRFGSTEYTDGFVDEAPEVEARACQVLLSRLRYMHQEHGITPELLYTGNPGESWIKDQFVMDPSGSMIELQSHRARVLFTINDNPNEDLRDAYKYTLSKLDAYDQARLLHGDWSAMPNVLRPFAFAFNDGKHVRPFKIDPRAPVWVWVDFNLDPFTALIAQQQGKTVGVGHEIAVNGGTMQELAQRIRAVVPNVFMHKYTGDRSGAARRIQSKSNASMWDDLLRELNANESQLDLPANPTHKESREQTNYLLHHGDVAIDPSCTGLIYDLRRVEVDNDLSIIKSDRNQASQRADLLDCFRYGVNTYLSPWIETHRKLHALQQLPKGPKPVVMYRP
jgi:phage terminase large subunit